jgi:hypothetical protein
VHKVLYVVLAFAGCACLVIGLITDQMWAYVGFFVFGGLMLVLYPRRAAGDRDDDVGQYAWLMPNSQPARTIVTFVMGLVCLGLAAMVVLD